MHRRTTRLALLLATTATTLASTALLSGCRGDRSEEKPRQFFPDMDDNPNFSPQAATPLFADGRQGRPPVDGTVAFGAFAFAEASLDDGAEWADGFLEERRELLGEGVQEFAGLNEDGTFVQSMPTSVTAELLARGEERFNIYCAACHGYAGDGNGMVGRRWSAPVPSFHDAKYKNEGEPTSGDGYLFHIARHGLKHPDGRYRMPGYGHALSTEDTWAIVAHIRVLQQAFDNDPQSLPAEARDRLDPRGRAAGSSGSSGPVESQGGGQ
ncbi:MAG: cytochrome c [Phycisphaerales bacterium]|jgi:mono/diheme cytochrome c family protein